jgi:PAS domain S-box-containing protein
MNEVERKHNNQDQDWQRVDARILGQLLSAQNLLFVLPDETRIAEFFSEALSSVPGIISCHVCLGNRAVPVGAGSKACRECMALRKKEGEMWVIPPHFSCGWASRQDFRVISLNTAEHTFGFFIFQTDSSDVFEPYWPFLNNLANYVALFLENRMQKLLLEQTRDELEDRVKKRTEELKQMNERFSLASRAARLGVWDWDLQKNELVWDDRMYELYGVKREDFTGAYEAWLQGVHPDDRASSDEISRQARRGERPYDTEFRVIWPDNSIHYLKAYGQFVRDENGRPIRMTGINYDITDQKRTQEALTLFRTLIDHTNDAIEVIDLEMGRFLDANEQAYHTLGYTREEFLTLTVLDIDPLVTTRSMKKVLEELRRSGSLTYESQHRHKDGSVFPVEINATYIRLDRDYVLTVARDITERKQMIEALAAQEREFRTLAENSPDNIIRYDVNCRAIYVNPALEKTLGTPVSEILGTTPVEAALIDEPEKYQAKIAKVFKTGIDDEIDIVLPDRGEGVRYHNIRFVAERGADGAVTGVQAIGRDVTERKQAEEEIQKMNRELEKRVVERTSQLQAANRELEAFAYSVSHDLRAPLRHIDGFLELLQKRIAEKLDKRSQHYMDTISDAAKRMGVLIDDLLAFSRMGRCEMATKSVELGVLVQEVIHEYKPETQDRLIHWHIADLPTVTGDRAMLRAALTNLIANALKFTRQRQPAEIAIGYLPNQNTETIIFIRDNGAGFDMAYADKLFGVFQRLHRVDEFEGSGIGLANVRRIIDRHGGRTWAEGQVNQGATFYFSLPQSIGET